MESVQTLHDRALVEPLSKLLDPTEIVAIFRRQWPIIAKIACTFVAVALFYVAVSTSKYTATATLLIDTRKQQLFQQQQVLGDMQFDPIAMESQAEILRSESIILSVIHDLDLVNDPEFVGTGVLGRMIGGVTSLFATENTSLEQYGLERRAVDRFQRALVIRRVGGSYAIDISFTSRDPARAAEIANKLAAAYSIGEMESKYGSAKRAASWLQARLKEIGARVERSDRAVQAFKLENDIFDTARGLVNDQQINDVSTQLVNARAAKSEAQARLERIQAVTQDGVMGGSLSDVLRSDIMSRLRAQYLDMAAREADWSTRYGSEHTATKLLRSQLGDLRTSMSDELNRISQSYASDYAIAVSRQQSLEQSLKQLMERSSVTAQAQIKLRDLESEANSSRALYDSFLQRLMEASQQETVPVSQARIISEAAVPLEKSFPKPSFVILAGIVLGLLAGGGVAIGQETMSSSIFDYKTVNQVTGLECLGVMPRVTAKIVAPGAPADVARRVLAEDLGIYRHVANAPLSRFTEVLRATKFAIRNAGADVKVIGVTSSVPSEGKTLVSSNLAQLIAQSGKKVILLDGNIRHPVMSHTVTPEATFGLVDILQGRKTYEEVMWLDPVTHLRVIPSCSSSVQANTADLLSSEAMLALLQVLRADFDYIFVDLPPTLPVVDVKAARNVMDRFLFIVEWGATSTNAVAEVFAGADFLRTKGIGVLLNKADPARLRRSEFHRGRKSTAYYYEPDQLG